MSGAGDLPPQDVHQRIVERVSDAIVSINQEYRCTYLNKKAEKLLERSEAELRGQTIWKAFPKTVDTIAEDKIKKSLTEQTQTSYERYNTELDRWFEVRIYPSNDGASILFTDISDRKQREIELTRYEQIVENLPVAVGQNELEADGEFSFVNSAMVEMFDAESKTEAKNHSVQDLCADPSDREALLKELHDSGLVQDKEFKLKTVNGDTLWGSTTARIETIGNEKYLLGIIQDITERKQYQDALNALLDATHQMASATTVQEVAEVVTTTIRESIGFAMNGVHLYDETAGGLAPVSVSHKSKQVIEEPPVLNEGIGWQAYKTGEPQIYHDLQAADEIYNDQTEIQSEIAFPLGDQGVLLVSSTETDAFSDRDITLANTLATNATAVLSRIQTHEQLQQREKTVEEQRDNLRIVNKIVRHDIRNDLQLISAYADRLANRTDEFEEPQKISKCVTNAVEVTETARDVTDMVLQAGQPDEFVNLNNILPQQIKNINNSYPRSQIETRGQIPNIDVVGSDMLESVFRNLLSNAIQHNTKEVPEVTVSVSQTASDAIIEIADNGPGIPDRHKEAMFEEGNSGLESDGTGLGLYLVKKVVGRNNGRVEVVDNEPEGSVFVVKLPKLNS
jgi:PAS domain S-box-containing protein